MSAKRIIIGDSEISVPNNCNCNSCMVIIGLVFSWP